MTPLWSACSVTILGALAVLSVSNTAARSQARPAPNVMDLEVRTPHFGFNRLLVSITVCAPGTQSCVTIDDVMVDTGSTGLRLEAAALPALFRLPTMTGPHQTQLGECIRFLHDNAWGGLFRADVHLGGLTADDLPVQIIGAGTLRQPASCPDSGTQPTSNGTLGIGPQLTDCPGACTQSVATLPFVFTCDTEGCVPLYGNVDPRYRLPNPASRLPVHNNGMVIDLPAAPGDGMPLVKGTLTFGVGTNDNNQLGDARILQLESTGQFTTLYEGQTYPDSYIDSGTETYMFADNQLPRCMTDSGTFCVAPSRRLDATIIGRDGRRIPIAFNVGHYENIRAHQSGASDRIAVAASSSTRAFAWGAPFFLGKRISVLMEGQSVPGRPAVIGPLYGIQ